MGPAADVYTLERIEGGRHAKIIQHGLAGA